MEGTASREALREDDRAVLGARAREEALGRPVVTVGEFRQGSWITPMAEAIEGFVAHSRQIDWHGPGGGGGGERSTSQVVGGHLGPRRRITGAEGTFLAAHRARPFKITLPTASNFYLASWHQELTAPYNRRARR
jgi:methionine synthase II (cobalamin-independent)